MLRQALYSPARFGMFQTLMDKRPLAFLSGSNLHDSLSTRSSVSVTEKLVASASSGAVGGLLSSPADLVMVRMQADGRLAPGVQRAYSGVVGGLLQVMKESGVKGLFRGCAPNVQRAAVTTATQLTAYTTFKELLESHAPHLGDGVLLHFSASMLAGVVVATCACPVDIMRTRMMNSKKASQGASEVSPPSSGSRPPTVGEKVPPPLQRPTRAYAKAYSSTLQCARDTLRIEGVRGFYKGSVSRLNRLRSFTLRSR
jgi:dicarboxylate transporter 10